MDTRSLNKAIKRAHSKIDRTRKQPPVYDSNTHVSELIKNKYFQNLLYIRDIIKRSCDTYFGDELEAINVDLFMLTTSVSSPMGPGSDSEPLPIKFGDRNAYLTDSSQFGFEPLLMNGFKRVYCYLPSMRGEDPDARHLNQFFHCEAEIIGNLDDIIEIVEGFIKHVSSTLVVSKKLITNTSINPKISLMALSETAGADIFQRITFDEACDLLIERGFEKYINPTEHGRDINAKGEQQLLKLIGGRKPVWILYYDRDRVPFYQKPIKGNISKALCADLIFPALTKDSFGGEIVGAGQRQDSIEEIYESLSRQNISALPYEWYIELRRHHEYTTTSGFGMGIERFIAWALCLSSIRDAIIYPREKNVITKP